MTAAQTCARHTTGEGKEVEALEADFLASLFETRQLEADLAATLAPIFADQVPLPPDTLHSLLVTGALDNGRRRLLTGCDQLQSCSHSVDIVFPGVCHIVLLLHIMWQLEMTCEPASPSRIANAPSENVSDNAAGR